MRSLDTAAALDALACATRGSMAEKKAKASPCGVVGGDGADFCGGGAANGVHVCACRCKP